MEILNQFGNGVCPDDCDEGVIYPELAEDQNCISSTAFTKLSQICDLWIRPNEVTAAPVAFTTGDMGNYLTANQGNAEDNTKIKWLTGKGGLPTPDKTTINLPKGQVRTTKRTYTMSFEVFGIDKRKYKFLQTLQCGDTGFDFIYATRGGDLFGDENTSPFFITPTSVDADLPLEPGDDDTVTGTIIITFESNVNPDCIENPFA